MTGDLVKGGNLTIETHTQGEPHGKAKAKIRVMCLQASEPQRSPANPKVLGERPGTHPLTSAQEEAALPACWVRSQASSPGEQPPSLWFFVPAAPGHHCTLHAGTAPGRLGCPEV